MSKINLPDNISSPQDLSALILEIRSYRKQLGHNSILSRTKKTAPKITDISKEALSVINTELGQKITSGSLDKLIRELESFHSHAEQLTITLVSPATPDIKEQLVGWCRKNLRHDILVNFSYNSNILGGLVVRTSSHIFDWSWRRQLLANSDKFAGYLTNVQ